MSAEARAMLDALMGGDRNASLPPGTALPSTNKRKATGALVLPRKKLKSVYDTDIDPLYCAWGFDVYELFVNTKSAIGANPNIVDSSARDEYLALPKHEQDRLGFEGILFRKLTELVRQCDRTVSRNKEKLQQELNKQREKYNGRDYIEEIDEGALQELARLTIDLEKMELEIDIIMKELENQVKKQKDVEEQIRLQPTTTTTTTDPIPADPEISTSDDTPTTIETPPENTNEQPSTLQTELHDTMITKQHILFDLARKVQQYAPTKEAHAFCLKNLHYIKSDISSDKTVCEVSGNFMSARDADERIAAHYAGKQYVGWSLVRAKLKELQNKFGRYGPPNPTRGGPLPPNRADWRMDERGSRDDGRGGGGRWEREGGFNNRELPRHDDRSGYHDRGGYHHDRSGGERDGGRGRHGDYTDSRRGW